jgi:hypothetical protein
LLGSQSVSSVKVGLSLYCFLIAEHTRGILGNNEFSRPSLEALEWQRSFSAIWILESWPVDISSQCILVGERTSGMSSLDKCWTNESNLPRSILRASYSSIHPLSYTALLSADIGSGPGLRRFILSPISSHLLYFAGLSSPLCSYSRETPKGSLTCRTVCSKSLYPLCDPLGVVTTKINLITCAREIGLLRYEKRSLSMSLIISPSNTELA